MTKRQAPGRHRATPVRTNPLESISKAVSSNAGSVGRQAAVIAAASGLVLTLGVPAQGAPAVREADNAPAADLVRASMATPATVKVPEKKAAKSAPVTVSVADIESTDGSAYRAAQRQAAAQREAAQEAAAQREAAQEAAAQREAAREAAAQREAARDAAAGAAMTRQSRQAPSASRSSSSASSSSASTSYSSRSSSQGTTTVASAEKPKEVASAPSAGLSGIAATAMAYKGAPYVFGGETPGGWDCSGFVKYVYAQHGISLPHGTSALRSSGKFVRTSNPKPGDLVFQNGGSHVGIYIGGGQIIGAQNPSVGTVLRPADSPYGPLTGYYTYAG